MDENSNQGVNEQGHLGALFLGSVGAENAAQLNSVQAGVGGNMYEIKLLAKHGEINFKVDTGAEVTVIGENHIKKFGIHKKQLQDTTKTLMGPGHKKLECLGYFHTWVSVEDTKKEITVIVCGGVQTALLGRPALEAFNIVKVKIPANFSCASIITDHQRDNDKIS